MQRKKAQGTLSGALRYSTGLSAVEIGGSIAVVQTGDFHTPKCFQVSSLETVPAPFGACRRCPARSSPVAREERSAGWFCVASVHFEMIFRFTGKNTDRGCPSSETRIKISRLEDLADSRVNA